MTLIRRGLVKIDYLARLGDKDTYKAKFEALCAALDKAPAVDAEPVRRGTWELVSVGVNGHITAYHGCSVCGCVFKSPSRYCPNCGAKMGEIL